MNVNNLLVKALGWKATIFHGDPSTYDRWVWLKRHLLPGSLRTLDAGCGSGAYTMYAAKIGNEAFGISDNENFNHLARTRANMVGVSGVKFLTADLRNLDSQLSRLGTFDQIICFETIEHILNDKKVVADLAALLKPGGRLLLTMPYRNHKALLYEQLSKTEDGGHVRWGYTHEEVRQLFADCGLETVCEDYISGLITQTLMNLMRVLLVIHQKFAWLVTFPLRILQILDRPLTDFTQYPYLSIAAIGVKRNSAFDADYFEKGTGTLFKKGYHKQMIVDYWKPVLNYILKLYRPERVLEVGCAKGFLIEELRSRGITAYGVDVSKYAISEAASEIKPFLKQCDVSNASLPYPEEFFDLILSFETLEHLTHPEKALAEMSRVLKKSGRIFISTPSPGTEVATADRTHVNVRSWRNWASSFNRYGIHLNRIHPWMWNPDIGRLGSFPEPWRTEIRKIIYTFLKILDMKLHIYGFGQKLSGAHET